MALFRNAASLYVLLAAALLADFTGTSQVAQAQAVRSMAPAAAAASTAPVMSQQFYGMHVGHLLYGASWPTMTFGTWRLWDAYVDWAQLEPSQNVYTWSTLDMYVALAQQKHIQIILELGQTPKWASARPGDANSGGVAEPSNDKYWTDYCTAVATRYKGKIAYYETWNEANSPTYFTGTPAKLVQLTAEASKAIKAADPAAQIISPSISRATADMLPWVKTLLQLGMGSSVDVIGAHFYSLGLTPEVLPAQAAGLEALLKQFGLGSKPIFNTEFGWASPNSFASQDEQAGWYLRSVMMGWTGGLQRFMWYAWDNNGWVTLIMSEPDYKTPTKAAAAMTTLEGWTVNKEVAPCVASGTTWSCDITDTSGDHSRIYWNTTGSATVRPSLTWTPTAVVTMYGVATKYTGGNLSITDLPVLVRE